MIIDLIVLIIEQHIYCFCDTHFRWDMSKPMDFWEMRECCLLKDIRDGATKKTFSCQHKPLLEIKIENVVLDELHLMHIVDILYIYMYVQSVAKPSPTIYSCYANISVFIVIIDGHSSSKLSAWLGYCVQYIQTTVQSGSSC